MYSSVFILFIHVRRNHQRAQHVHGQVQLAIAYASKHAFIHKLLQAINRPCRHVHHLAVNDAAITAAFANVPISQKILCETLDCMRPSVTEEMLAEYDKLRDKMTGMERRAARTPIGFKRQTH